MWLFDYMWEKSLDWNQQTCFCCSESNTGNGNGHELHESYLRVISTFIIGVNCDFNDLKWTSVNWGQPPQNRTPADVDKALWRDKEEDIWRSISLTSVFCLCECVCVGNVKVCVLLFTCPFFKVTACIVECRRFRSREIHGNHFVPKYNRDYMGNCFKWHLCLFSLELQCLF